MASQKNIRVLQDILYPGVSLTPDKIALICENEKVTYKQIDTMSDRMAQAFVKNGVKSGDRVLFFMLNSVELVVGIFAALKANAIFVGVDSGNTYETLKYIAEDCGITSIVTYDHRFEIVNDLMRDVSSLKFAVLTGKKTEGLTGGNLLSFNSIQSEYPAITPVSERIENDVAYLIYTSGSTGKSKGVMVTHRSILFTIRSGIEFFKLSPADVHTSPLQLSFSPGINQMLQTILVGGTLILEKSLAFPMMMMKRMATEGATGFAGVPTMLMLLMQMDLNKFDLSKLRFLSSVGAALPDHLIKLIHEKLPNASICSYYGMAEASYSLGLDPEQIAVRPTSVGKPFPGTQAWIVDEKGNRVEPGEIGTLILRGSHVRSGYWNYPEGTAQRFLPGLVPGEQICFTGDMFRQDEDGYFYFLGRSDEILKSGAKKVVPREIENIIYDLDGVLEVAVIGIPDPVLGHALKAFVVPTREAREKITSDSVLQYCKQRLEMYKVPREIEIRDSLPKTASGKITKTSLS